MACADDPLDPAGDHVPADLDPLLRELGADVDDALAEGAMRCGPYILLDEVGEGGFGEVFAAVRDDATERRVAVKILKRGLDTRDVLRRFELEQRALARIDHPCVAAILDSGMTDDGRPWFAMPLLDGEPVTVACDEACSPLAERLRLLTLMCDAVQAAHVQGIAHRDLKPGNVLVVRGSDGIALPKVIDFGIAKALDPEGAADATRTAPGGRIGTPAYMAPEQLVSECAGADARSDVYALGVIMAELVAGVRPSAPSDGGAPAVPVHPSRLFASVAAGDPAVAAQVAAARGLRSAQELRRALRGDIDAIVTRATMPEPERRYQSAEAMAADLRRMAASMPVLARSPSRSYHLARFVRRHRIAVTAAAVAVLMLLATSAAAVVGSVRAERNAARASQQAVRAEQVTGLLRGVFERIDPEVAQGRDRTLMIELLRGTLEELQADEGARDPQATAEVARIVASALIKLEQPRLAIEGIDAALRRVDAAMSREGEPMRRRQLRIERAALRVEKGTAIFEASWADAGVIRARLDEPLASVEWRAALEELADEGALDGRTALLARLRIWRLRETWPSGTPIEEFDAAIDAEVEAGKLTELERWTYLLRKAESQSWSDVLTDFPRVLEECQTALGSRHPLVVRARNRGLGFEVCAAIDARTPRDGVTFDGWRDDAALASQWQRAASLADGVVADCEDVFGPSHTQTLAARLWQLAARGAVDGSAAVGRRYRELRADAVNAKGEDSALVRQVDAIWRGMNEGYAQFRWW
ncbi:MAG: serine/threonine protein kinase [Phycisphaerales bacterium]|nr:serine/threonine protein kinase [Phycisphaerales bacterium]